jgi:hypothetical protein
MQHVATVDASVYNDTVSDKRVQHLSTHSCKHCQDIVIDMLKNWNEITSVLLKYSTIADLLQAYHECLFIRLTLVHWESYLVEQSLQAKGREEKYNTKKNLLTRFSPKTKQPSVIHLNIRFEWNYPKDPQLALGAVELQWDINGQSRDSRLFLIDVDVGKPFKPS